MATRTTDMSCSFIGNPIPIGLLFTSAETLFKGSMIFGLAAGNCTKTWATTLPFVGFSPFGQTVAAGGVGIVYVGSYIAVLPQPTAAIAATAEHEAVGMGAAGDNWMDAVISPLGAGATAGDSLIGRVLRITSTEVYLAVKSMDVYGISSTAYVAKSYQL